MQKFTGKLKQLTDNNYTHCLTYKNVFSFDSQWIVYDTRSKPEVFDGKRIEKVNIHTGEVVTLYKANTTHVGVVTYHPQKQQVIFIESQDKNAHYNQYTAYNRKGVIYDEITDSTSVLDARDLGDTCSPGALRGGTHVHIWNPNGTLISNTYEDFILAQRNQVPYNRRCIAVSIPNIETKIDQTVTGNYSGTSFSFIASKITDNPIPGTDEINLALEEGFIGKNGYINQNNQKVDNALAFQGQILTSNNQTLFEIFIVDLPNNLQSIIESSFNTPNTERLQPPTCLTQRRLTFTANEKHPGIQGPRHWLKSNNKGSLIYFYKQDDNGIVQLFSAETNTGLLTQITHNPYNIFSEFAISSDNVFAAYLANGSLHVTELSTGYTECVTKKIDNSLLSPDSVIISPDNKMIVYGQKCNGYNQLMLYTFKH